jgi:hypothetical protein
MRITKLATMVVAAAAVLAFGAATASASTGVSVPGGAITGTGTAITFSGGFGSITCPVTLVGSLNARINKTVGATVGTITSGSVGACSGSFGVVSASASVLGFPWTVTYRSFSGTLPNISRVNLVANGAAFLISASTLLGQLNCLYRDNVDTTTVGAPTVTGLNVNDSSVALNTILPGTTGTCPNPGAVSGTFNLSASQRMTLF